MRNRKQETQRFSSGSMAIRPLRSEDVHAHYEAVHESFHDLKTEFSWCKPCYSLSDSADFINKRSVKEWGKEYHFAIAYTATNYFLGVVSLQRLEYDPNIANLSVWVRSSQRRRGIATKAVKLLVEYGCHILDFKEVEYRAKTHNEASQQVAVKAGFSFVGLKKIEGQAYKIYRKGCKNTLLPISHKHN